MSARTKPDRADSLGVEQWRVLLCGVRVELGTPITVQQIQTMKRLADLDLVREWTVVYLSDKEFQGHVLQADMTPSGRDLYRWLRAVTSEMSSKDVADLRRISAQAVETMDKSAFHRLRKCGAVLQSHGAAGRRRFDVACVGVAMLIVRDEQPLRGDDDDDDHDHVEKEGRTCP